MSGLSGLAGLDPAVRQLVLDLGHTVSHSAVDFIVSEHNELAFRHIAAYPEWPGPLTLIVGPAKAGKSHLAGIWAERVDAVLVEPGTLEALATTGGKRPAVVENADRGTYPEAALFHLLNQSMRESRPVLMTARRDPKDWPLATEDVRSRVRLAAQFRVAAADDTQLSQMLVKLFGDRQIAVDPTLIGYVVRRMEREPNEAVALVSLMDGLAMARRTGITRGIAAEAIALRSVQRGLLDDNNDREDANRNE